MSEKLNITILIKNNRWSALQYDILQHVEHIPIRCIINRKLYEHRYFIPYSSNILFVFNKDTYSNICQNTLINSEQKFSCIYFSQFDLLHKVHNFGIMDFESKYFFGEKQYIDYCLIISKYKWIKSKPAKILH